MNKKIDILKVRDFAEDKLNKIINEINDPNIEPKKKRLYALNLCKSSYLYSESIDFPNNTKQIFDMNKIRNYREKKLEENMKNIKYEKLSEKQKRLFALDELNTSSSSNNKEKEEEDKEEEKKVEKKKVEEENTTEDINISTDYSSSISIINEERKNYFLKNDLYDKYDIKIKDENIKYLTLVPIEKDKNLFLYKNDLNTYYFVKNFRFGEISINSDILTDNQYNKSYGLFFCGNEIKLENNEIKKCCPNEMICKQCMEKNKKRYKLKKNYLININGRTAKKYKEKFHCFGFFAIGNQFENCIDEFSCKACQFLDKYEKYYLP